MTGIYLDADHGQAIAQVAANSYPRECCGLLVGRLGRGAIAAAEADPDCRQVVEVIALENAWASSLLEYTDPQTAHAASHSARDRYWIDPADLLRVQQSARESGLAIVGIYHSHPDHPAVPSECDRALAWPVYSYVIISVIEGQAVDLKSWRLDDDDQFQPEPVKMIGSSINKPLFLS
ncbi:M67 family metallopeptidase [Nodosilinea sp. LEGE 07088]|uniref:Mov34/MPN/PAD-1 family protein n=1 Tax=Nodosilinea sp. LEGE 07088 TaxID=2777968 RepID=UPI00188307B2|nr:M67 family metallopeptidase [Nodosilinea sp. LEGE 07088]MBE9138158.1 M67 family metallopeptidase [Nodosilinea sp. LEGE 07088]